MRSLVEILMERDRMTFDEANELIDETREMILDSPEDADEIMSDMLGLEPDYLDVMF